MMNKRENGLDTDGFENVDAIQGTAEDDSRHLGVPVELLDFRLALVDE